MRDPLVLPAAALAAGIFAQGQLRWRPDELWPALGALVCLAAVGQLARRRRAVVAALVAAVALVGALRLAVSPPAAPPQLDAAPRELLLFSGCVTQPPALSEDRQQFVLELAPGARALVNFYLDGDQPPPLAYGQRVELEGRARPVRNFQNAGSFDYAAYLARREVYWTVTAYRRTPVRVLAEDCGSPHWRLIYRLREAALKRIEGLYVERPYDRAVLEAVLIGSAGELDGTLSEAWRRTGTYHALVVSGLQVTVLAAVFLFLFRLCLLPETLALMLTCGATWLYALAAGAEAPVLRAAAGFTLFVIGRCLYRRLRLLNLLAAVAIVFLLVDPWELFEASFQLSFLAVAAIGALALPVLEATSAPLARGLAGLQDRARDLALDPRAAHFRVELRLLAETVALWTGLRERWALATLALPLRAALMLFDLAVVSLAVQIGLALPMVLYFHRLSLSGLSANLLIGPLMSALAPLGFLALATGWAPAVGAAAWLAELSRRVVEWHASWEPNWRIPDPPQWLLIAAGAALVGLAAVARRGGRAVLIALAVLLSLLALLIVHPFAPAVRRGALELAAVDVGQGESLFLAFPTGALMVLDGGGIPAIGRRRPRLDIGEDVVSAYLWRRGIKRLEVLAATHGHEDHLGGLAALLENFRPRQLWFGAMPETPAWRAITERARRRGVRLIRLRAGDSFVFARAQVEVLAPEADYQPGSAPQNNDSLVLRISFGRHRFLLTGDIEAQAEAGLIERGALGKLDVLKVAHHGSRTSTSDEFLDLTRPALALISAGFQNSHNLPHPALLKRLDERRTVTLRTDRHGLIRVLSDGRHLELDTAGWQP